MFSDPSLPLFFTVSATLWTKHPPTHYLSRHLPKKVVGMIQTQRIRSVGSVLELVDWHAEDDLYASSGKVLQLFRVNTFLK